MCQLELTRSQLSDDRFEKMLSTYESEQAALNAEATALRTEISAAREKADCIEKFLKLCAVYTDFSELTAEASRTFIEKIVVHESVKAPGHKWKKSLSRSTSTSLSSGKYLKSRRLRLKMPCSPDFFAQ
jgi:hypothetical protein